MPYVGNIPAEKYASFEVQHFTTSATPTYSLTHAVANENDIRLVINNVIQQPGSGKAYTASGTTLTLSAATSGTDTMYCVFLGKAVQTVVPPEASVTGDMLSDTVISGQLALGAEPADTDEFLVSDAGVLKRVDYSYIKPTAQVYRDAQPIMINGNYEVWQRGTSFTTSVYTADRWKQDLSGATATVSRQTFTVGQSDVPNNPKYHLRQTVSTANNNCGIFYRHEDVTTLTGNITIAFYAKGTNPNGGNLNIITKQSFGSGGSTAVETSTQNITLTASWQQFVFNFSLASISGKTVGANSYLQMLIKQPDGDASTNAWTLDLANFQVEEGTYTSATLPPFQSETYGSNESRCLRYFEKSYEVGVNPATATSTGIIRSGGNQGGRTSGRMGGGTTYVVGKGTAPTVVFYDSSGNSAVMSRIDQGSGSGTSQNATLASGSSKSMEVTSTGTYTGDVMNYHFTADAEL